MKIRFSLTSLCLQSCNFWTSFCNMSTFLQSSITNILFSSVYNIYSLTNILHKLTTNLPLNETVICVWFIVAWSIGGTDTMSCKQTPTSYKHRLTTWRAPATKWHSRRKQHSLITPHTHNTTIMKWQVQLLYPTLFSQPLNIKIKILKHRNRNQSNDGDDDNDNDG